MSEFLFDLDRFRVRSLDGNLLGVAGEPEADGAIVGLDGLRVLIEPVVIPGALGLPDEQVVNVLSAPTPVASGLELGTGDDPPSINLPRRSALLMCSWRSRRLTRFTSSRIRLSSISGAMLRQRLPISSPAWPISFQ